MKLSLIVLLAVVLSANAPAHAIDAKYRQKLASSGCTQMSEMQGCDVNKTKEENAKAGFVTNVSAGAAGSNSEASQSPYVGNWVALGSTGEVVAEIGVENVERATVNGQEVEARRFDGALIFKRGSITYIIQGDRRLTGEDYWFDSDSDTKGPINKGD